MNEDKVRLVNRAYAQMLQHSDEVAAAFYQALFVLDPEIRKLFPRDLTEQGRKLMAVVGTVVGNARNPGALRGALEQLAIRHARYGVRAKHFELVGAALLSTLEQRLGDDFTAADRAAWLDLYTEIVTIMAPALESAIHRAASGPFLERPGERRLFTQPRSLLSRLAFWR